jgi:hypothetical protein
MTNHELIESWASSFGAARLDSSRYRHVSEEEAGAQEWSWKILGLVTAVGVSVAGWVGAILAVHYFAH